MKKKYFGSHFTCTMAESARENDQNPPERCSIRMPRKNTRFFQGEPYCHSCVLEQMSEHRIWKKQRYQELKRSQDLTEQEQAELRKLEARFLAIKKKRRAYYQRYRAKQNGPALQTAA